MTLIRTYREGRNAGTAVPQEQGDSSAVLTHVEYDKDAWK